MFQRLLHSSAKPNIFRGMFAYAILWPSSCLIEQSLVERRTLRTFDYKKCIWYSLFGSFIVAPTLFVWVRIAAHMWPKRDFVSSMCKGLTEQVAIDPFGITMFLYTMSLVEGKSKWEAEEEVKSKFFGIYRIGVIYWPVVQTANFMLVPERNQVVITSIYSLIWTTFLAYVHAQPRNNNKKKDKKV